LFKKDTVFVMGAGASAEFGLPVGIDLADTIARLMRFEINCGLVKNGDPFILNVLNNKSNCDNKAIKEHRDAARRISEGITHAGSIDQYLDMHGNDEMAVFCGKAAIVKAILEAEKESGLYYDSTQHPRMINFNKLQDHWMKPFFKQLTDRRRKSDLDQIFSGITIICFNYDRCIEHYLIHALQELYAISANEAAKLVELLEIYYPYGKVGKLKTELGQPGVAFGADLGINEFIQAVQGIRTYTEQVEDEGSLTRIKRAITNAKAIVFLGFAYHSQNMELLGSAPGQRGEANAIFGTAFGMSDHNAKVASDLAQKLTRGYTPMIEIDSNLKCGQLLKDYQMSL
jgi:hypothetical protein